MENSTSAATGGANNTVVSNSADKSFLQCVGDSVKHAALLPILGCALNAAIAPAGAAELAPVASQVASIKVEVTKATLQGLKIDPDSLADFDKLSAANQGKVLFFLDGLKKAQKFPDTAAEKLPSLKEAAEKLIFLFNNQQINEASRQAMSKMDGTLGKVRNVERLITQLSDPQSYGVVLASPNSPYGQRFSQEKQAMMATYTEAETLQAKAEKMDSPKLAEAKKRNEATQRELARLESQAAELQKTNAALGRVVSSFR